MTKRDQAKNFYCIFFSNSENKRLRHYAVIVAFIHERSNVQLENYCSNIVLYFNSSNNAFIEISAKVKSQKIAKIPPKSIAS